MISSTSASTSDRAHQAAGPAGPSHAAARSLPPRFDRISTEGAAFLRAELNRQPEVRPEVLARARELAADPAYPSREILADVAGKLLAAPDLTDDQS